MNEKVQTLLDASTREVEILEIMLSDARDRVTFLEEQLAERMYVVRNLASQCKNNHLQISMEG